MMKENCLSKIVPVFCVAMIKAFFRHVDFKKVGKDWIGKPRGTAAKWLKIKYDGMNPPEDGCVCSVTVSKLVAGESESYIIVLKSVSEEEIVDDCPNFFLGYLGKRFNVEFLTGNDSNGLFVDGFVVGAFQKAA